MTGSLMSSLVIGQRNSPGIPEEKESLLSSSTFLHSLLRRPTDSTHKNTRAKERETEKKADRVHVIISGDPHENKVTKNKLNWHKR